MLSFKTVALIVALFQPTFCVGNAKEKSCYAWSWRSISDFKTPVKLKRLFMISKIFSYLMAISSIGLSIWIVSHFQMQEIIYDLSPDTSKLKKIKGIVKKCEKKEIKGIRGNGSRTEYHFDLVLSNHKNTVVRVFKNKILPMEELLSVKFSDDPTKTLSIMKYYFNTENTKVGDTLLIYYVSNTTLPHKIENISNQNVIQPLNEDSRIWVNIGLVGLMLVFFLFAINFIKQTL